MNRIILFFFLFVVVITFGCTKKTDVTTAPPITIQSTGGSNQTDTIGKTLAKDIVININEPGSGLNNLLVQIFQNTLCNGDSVIEKTVTNGSNISFSWKLNSKPGTQTLKFKVLNSSKMVIDSIIVTATAIPPTHGWHTSACLPQNNLQVSAFGKLNSGRLLVSFFGAFFPYYSDDNGITWQPIKTFSLGFAADVEQITVTPTDEIFLGEELTGVYYSADKGATWQRRSAGLPYYLPIINLVYLPNGTLLFTSTGYGVYISKDKGLSWIAISASNSGSYGYQYLATQNNGDIYLLGQGPAYNPGVYMYRLDHSTLQLQPVTNLPPIPVSTLYFDQNNYMYAGGTNIVNNSAELYKSSDNGLTWSKIFTSSSGTSSHTLLNITKQIDGYYYFLVANSIYYKTADFVTFQQVNVNTATAAFGGQYILSNQNYFLFNSLPKSIWYYVP